MSILWRCSVASRPEFDKLKLGGPHEERLRKMLLANDSGEPHEYGCLLSVHFGRDEVRTAMNELIEMPEMLSSKIEGHRAVRAIFGGMWWMWIVSSHSKYFDQRAFLSRQGDLPIVDAGERGYAYLRKFGQKLKAAGMLDN